MTTAQQHLLSASYSGGSVKDSGNKGSTVFDSSVPEAYATISDAQKEHAKYQSNQVRSPDGSLNANEYDDITHEGSVRRGVVGGREEGGSGGGIVGRGHTSQRMQARNFLYEDNELPEEIKHPAVHADSFRTYSGAVHKDRADSYITCRCKTKALVFTFFIVMALLFAVASLVLCVLLWFDVPSSSSSSSSPSPSPVQCTCPDYERDVEELQELRATLTQLTTRLETLKNKSAQTSSAITNRLHSDLSQVQADVTQLQNMHNANYTVTVGNVSLYDGCYTRTPFGGTCTISGIDLGETQNPCVTVTTNVVTEGEVLMDARCIVDDGPHETDRIVATLEMLMNENGEELLRCRCSKVIPDSSVPSSSEESRCTLRVTRCPQTTDIIANVTRQA